LNKDVGVIVNVSRDIIYAGNDEKFALASQIQAQYYQQKMQKILNEKKYL
jgi:orotidine-5'-phosphate decarboxylase